MIIKGFNKKLPWNKKIEILRVANSWTQVEAAERCNTNQKIYWSWEKGKNYPRKKSQDSIARAYGVQVEDIFPV
ncbi:helix-turn-helix transcriptional regulator [Clostridium cochlearium]|uniref:helix-turn-helix transcriptional regulator n=1 Tax=Clostridium cochlearium TaxID=1494 RepID=UPI000BBC33DB|nr:helix-turn-helix transcriptional regulator [Clostridium cochlearium]